jgi:hypothetical protein
MRFVTLAVAVLAASTASAEPPATPAAKPLPMVVRVDAAAGGGVEVETWAKELRTALAAHKGEFRLAKPHETPELILRIDSVAEGDGNTHVMKGALVLGKTVKPFDLSYPDDTRSQAEKLARNLRKLADQVKASSS